MNGITVLIDTNIILDIAFPNVLFADTAKEILKKCRMGEVTGFIAAHSIPNIFYILRKQYSVQERKDMLFQLCKIIKVVAIDQSAIVHTLTNIYIDDIEDCLQIECAKTVNADYIVTRNIDDFKASPIPAVMPDAFLKKLDGINKNDETGY
jgi:predicted nucleic acid-binding protein